MQYVFLFFTLIYWIIKFIINHIREILLVIGILLFVILLMKFWKNRFSLYEKVKKKIQKTQQNGNLSIKNIRDFIQTVSKKTRDEFGYLILEKLLKLPFAKSMYVNEAGYKLEKKNKITFDMFEMTNFPLNQHPLAEKSTDYIRNYLKVVNTYVKKYSDITWSNSILEDYYLTFLKLKNVQVKEIFKSEKELFVGIWKVLLGGGKGKHEFYKYLILDILYICNAIVDEKKGNVIFADLASHYFRIDEAYINEFYYSLYHDEDLNKSLDSLCMLKIYWVKNRLFLKTKRKKVLIVANMSAGKSTLINAITGKKLSETKNESCTSKLRYIFNKVYFDGENVKYDKRFNMHVSDDELRVDQENNEKNCVYIGTSFQNSNLQAERILVIDTPGVNSYLDQEHRKITEAEIVKKVDSKMIYLLNATNIGTYDEKKQLEFIKENFKGTILFAINKLDKFRKGEDSVENAIEQTKKKIEEIGFQKPIVVPISAYAAYLAKMKISGCVLNEDEEDEFELFVRKFKKNEYQFNTYYPEDVQKMVKESNEDKAFCVLYHSGILQLENLIKQEDTP